MPGSPDVTRLIRRETLVEILGYAGAAAALVGTLIAFSLRAYQSESAALAVSLVVTAVLVAAGVATGDRTPDAYQRMRSVLWFAAVISFGLASAIFGSNTLNLGGKSAATLAGGMAAGFGLLLWLMLRRSLQQIAFFLAAAGTITILAVPSNFNFVTDLRNVVLVVWTCGVVWFIAGTVGIVRPPRTARVLGALVALFALEYLFASSFSLALTLTSLTSLVLLAVGDWKEDRAVAGLGIAGVLVASGVEVVHVVGRSQSAADAAIAIGLGSLVVAIAAVRMTKPADVPPTPGVEGAGVGDEPVIPPPPAVD